MGRVAEQFYAARTYAVGDLCIHDGNVYRFTSPHSGAWTDADAEREDIPLGQDVTRVLAGYEQARMAGEFGGTMVFEASPITGTRYKYTITDAADPRIY